MLRQMLVAPIESSYLKVQFQKDLKGLLKQRLLSAISVSGSVVLGWNPTICISNELLGDADAAGPGIML